MSFGRIQRKRFVIERMLFESLLRERSRQDRAVDPVVSQFINDRFRLKLIRDGAMRVDGNHGSTLGYEPNSYGEWQEQPDFAEQPLNLEGAAGHWSHRVDEDYYSQPGKLFRLMSDEQKKALFENTGRAMGDAPKEVKLRHIGNCAKADPAYGAGVAKALEISMSGLPKAGSR